MTKGFQLMSFDLKPCIVSSWYMCVASDLQSLIRALAVWFLAKSCSLKSFSPLCLTIGWKQDSDVSFFSVWGLSGLTPLTAVLPGPPHPSAPWVLKQEKTAKRPLNTWPPNLPNSDHSMVILSTSFFWSHTWKMAPEQRPVPLRAPQFAVSLATDL